MAEPANDETADLLFAYAAGTLDDAARRRVEALLDADPALRGQLAWYEAVCDQVIEQLPAPQNLPSVERILSRIRPPSKDVSSRGWTWWKPAAAFLILAQAVAIGLLMNGKNEDQLYRSIAPGGGQAGKQVLFVIAFLPETPESKVRALLLKAGATIVDGPKQMGDYSVAVPLNRAQYAQQLFQDSGIAEYVRKIE
jgi:anti-sigma factor RsiW